MKKIVSLILVAIMLVTAMPMAFAEGNTYKVGDIIQFGSYPQSEVKDETLIAELNALAPEWDEWINYGYYSGNGNFGSMVQGDWMRYIDVTYNGNKYRGVKFTQYRPIYSYVPSSYTYQTYHGYSTNIIYWFIFEAIDWCVLDPSTGFVMCETIIDSQAYSNTIYYNSDTSDDIYAYFNDASYTNYASDYETSSIRKWLNEDFYNTAFTDSEKKEINTTTLNNDGYYTSVGTTGYEKLDSNDTEDKIFLLSYNESRNKEFGFDLSSFPNNKISVQCSDYANSQGLTRILGRRPCWLLRSSGYSSSGCYYVYTLGYSVVGNDVCNTDYGIRPALCFNDIESLNHKHSYNEGITPPTCKDKGFTTYTCECGDSYVDDYEDTVNHKDDNSDYKCDYNCGYEFEKPAPEVSDEPEAEPNFFQKIVKWFKDLFDKLFGWMKK